MKRISGEIYGLLMRQGTSAKTVGAVDARGIDAGERETGAAHPAIGRRPGGETGPMGMGLKGTPTAKASASFQEVRHTRIGQVRRGGLVLRVFTNPNMSGMPMRQGAVQRTPSLMCIAGGKL